MKFLIDVGVGKKVELFLKSENHDVKSVREINPSLSDFDILQIAIAEERIIITMDKDFGELVYNARLKFYGVLLLRLENMNGDEKTGILEQILQNHSSQLEKNFCVFQKGKFRVRHK